MCRGVLLRDAQNIGMEEELRDGLEHHARTPARLSPYLSDMDGPAPLR